MSKPYQIALIMPTAMGDSQAAWFYHELKQRVTGIKNLQGEEGHVVVRQFVKFGRPHAAYWLSHAQRRQHVSFVFEDSYGSDRMVEAQNLLTRFDEVWCFGGYSSDSRGDPALIFRWGKALNGSANKFKFIPSWVERPDSSQPKKEKKPCLKNNWI